MPQPSRDKRKKAPPPRTDAPHSDEAERAVLGAVLSDATAYARIADLLPDTSYFFREQNQVIWQHVQKLARSNTPIDIITLIDSLQAENEYSLAGGVDYLTDLTGAYAGSSHIRAHADVVARHAILRSLLTTLADLSTELMSRPESLEEVEQIVTSKVDEALQRIPRSVAVGGEALATAFVDSHNDVDTSRRIYFGSGIRQAVPYVDPGELLVCGGAPGTGKTAFWLQAMLHLIEGFDRKDSTGNVVRQEPVHVLFYSLEIDELPLAVRMSACRWNVPASVGQGLEPPDHKDAENMEKAVAWMKSMEGRFEIVTVPCNPTAIRSRIIQKQRELRGQKLLVIVDHFQLLSIPQGRNESAATAYNRAARELAATAKTCKVPMVVLSSLNRPDRKADKKALPDENDLKESGDLGSVAHAVYFVHAPGKRSDTRRQFVVAKDRGRDGLRDPIEYEFLGAFQRFRPQVGYTNDKSSGD